MALVFALPLSPLAVAGWAGISGPLVVTVIAAADVMLVTRSASAVRAPDVVAALADGVRR
jgi:hypothetical protein